MLPGRSTPRISRKRKSSALRAWSCVDATTPLTNRERRRKGRDFYGAHLAGMALTMEEDVALDPVDVRLLSSTAVVACANRVTDAVEELRLRRLGRGGFAKDGGGRRALGGDTVSDRSHRGPSVHRRPPGVPTIARGARQRQARLFWPPRLSAGRYGPILERRASASGNAPPGAPEGEVQYRAGVPLSARAPGWELQLGRCCCRRDVTGPDLSERPGRFEGTAFLRV